MVRSPRLDAPGRFHHIYNRAARRKVLFADQRDYRYVLALLAYAVRRGELVRSGLLATLACLSVDSIASLLHVHRATAARSVRRYRALLSHAPYATQAGHAARAAIDPTLQS